MAIESQMTTVDGRAIRALIELAQLVSGGGDPRPALYGAAAAASLIGAGVEINEQTLPGVASAISYTAASETDKLLPQDDAQNDQAPAADAAA